MRIYEYEIRNDAGDTMTKRIEARTKAEAVDYFRTATIFINNEAWTLIKSSFRRVD